MFKFVSNMKQFVDIFGEPIQCQMQKTPEPYKLCLEEEGKPEKSKKDKKIKKRINKLIMKIIKKVYLSFIIFKKNNYYLKT